MGIFGGSSSSSSTLNNAIAFNPIITVGDNNKADSTTKQKGTAKATATAKDEFGMSAGFALGPNSQAQGGPIARSVPIARSGDVQPMSKIPAKNDNFFKDGVSLSSINPLYAAGGVLLAAGVYFIYKMNKAK